MADSASRTLVIATVLFYLVAALAMVMANKWVLNTTEVPLFFLWCQLFIAILFFVACNALGLFKGAHKLTLDWTVARQLDKMIALSVAGLSFNNFTLKYVDASFYQVARGLVLPFTVLASYYLLASRPSKRIAIACGAVTAGFFIGVFLDAVPVSFIGIGFGVSSSLLTALHAVIIKTNLDVVGGSALQLSWYMNLLSAIVLLPFVSLVGEAPGVWRLLSGQSEAGTFIWGTLITGAVGFLMSIASPFEEFASSLLGVWLFHDIIGIGRATSILAILVGSIYYTWVKHQESQPVTQGKQYERVAMESIDLESAGLLREDLEDGNGKDSPRK